SNPLAFTINNGSNNVTAIQACGTAVQQFFNYTINGASYEIGLYPQPIDTFNMFLNQQMNPARIEIYAQRISNAGSTHVPLNIVIGFNQPGIAVGSNQNMTWFYSSEINDSTYISTPIPVNITEYGAVGQFISGNFTGAVNGALPASVYNVTGSFRVRRGQ
ncbi:MAG: hypothetical protein RL092_1816, partial [Bacteroidota bacterium]